MLNRMLLAGLSAAAVGLSAPLAAAQRDSRDADRPSPEAEVAEAEIRIETWEETKPLTRPTPPQPFQGGAAGGPVDSLYMMLGHEPEGDWPYGLAIMPDGAQVAVSHRLTDNVVFIDVETGTALAAVDVGEYAIDVAITPDGTYALSADVFSNQVSFIDIETHTVVAEVPVTGNQPYRIRVTPDGQHAVVGIINDGTNSAFSIIDIEAKEEILTFASGGQGQYGGWFTPESASQGPIVTSFWLTPDGTRIVQPHRSGNEIRVYEVTSGDLLANVPSQNNPTRVDFTSDGTIAAVQHDAPAHGITRFNLQTYTIEEFFPVAGIGSRDIRVTPNDDYVIAGSGNNLVFVNFETGVVETTLSTGAVFALTLSQDGQYAFVGNLNARVIDIATQQIVATVTHSSGHTLVASPVTNRIVMLDNRRREDIHLYNVDGASAFHEYVVPSGVPPEVDAPRNVAISPDGSLAVITNNSSYNAVVFDMEDLEIRSFIEIGDRPLSVAITPDGQYALAAVAEAHALQIIDLNTDELVASVPIIQRPSVVLVSPDSQTAYVRSVAAGPKVTFVNIDGADSAVTAQFETGFGSSHQAPTYTEFAGMTLSPDGSLLAVTDTGGSLVRLYDTENQTELTTVPVGTFPIRVAFSPDGSLAFVACMNAAQVDVIAIDGADSTLVGTISGIFRPLVMHVDAAGEYLYVGNTTLNVNDSRLFVVEIETLNIVAELPLPSNARHGHMLPQENTLYIGTADPGVLLVIDPAGPDTTILEQHPLANGPSDMAFNEATRTMIFAQPIWDGIDILWFDTPSVPCPGDLDDNNSVDVFDLLLLLAEWGACADPQDCPADLTGDGAVDVFDLLELLANWGPCP